MSTLTGHISLFATQSLKSIDKWMAVVQGNLNGTVRIGFKEATLTYGGNTTSTLKETSMLQNGIQIAEQALNVGHIDTNWSNGEVNRSTQETHFAIQGSGFFLVTDPKKSGGNGFDGRTSPTGATPGVYVTRDGEFHWGKNPSITGVTDLVLLTKEGLVVQSDITDGVTLGNSDNIYGPVTYSDFHNPDKKVRPSVIQPCLETTTGSGPVVNIIDYKDLKYSAYGSTVLEAPTSQTIKTIVNGTNGVLSGRDVTSLPGDTMLVEKSLEASNVRFDRNIAELAALGKIYNGFVQVIKVYNSSLDDVLGFIR